jgi:hypothetical protein
MILIKDLTPTHAFKSDEKKCLKRVSPNRKTCAYLMSCNICRIVSQSTLFGKYKTIKQGVFNIAG